MSEFSKRGVSDENLIRRELYNAGDVAIDLELMLEQLSYIKASGITPGFVHAVLQPRSWIVINHAFYRLHSRDGRSMEIVTHFGDRIGKKHTKASNPLVSEMR